MDNKKLIYFTLITLLAIGLILGIIILTFKNNDELQVYFLDVGQGDAILIKNGANQTLIDSGRNGRIVLEKLGKAMPFWDRKIEALIITHPDADHYGGVSEILDFYKVENIIKTDAVNSSGEWSSLMDKIKSKRITAIKSTAGTEIIFPAGARLKIIYPENNTAINAKDRNDASIVTRLVFGENEFLFTGDLAQTGENFLVNNNIDIKSDFLKVGHHGSKSSTTDNFLDKVNPQDAIISVGKNSYGHPHKEILDRLKNRGILIWRTDEYGMILYKCKNINQMCQVSL